MISYTIPTPEPDIFRHSGHAYCPVCEKPVDLLSIGEAARLFRTDRHDIAFLAENRRLHRVHNKAGAVMICSLSLFDCFESRETRLLDARFPDSLHS
jgi:hypothetical protein